MAAAAAVLWHHCRCCHLQDAYPLQLCQMSRNKLCRTDKKIPCTTRFVVAAECKERETECEDLCNDTPVWHVGWFRIENGIQEAASSNKKHERQIYCACVPSHLLVRSEHYQLLRFPDHTFSFCGSLKNETMALHCTVFYSLKRLSSLYTTSCRCTRHIRLGAMSGVQPSKKGNRKANYQTYVPNGVAYAAHTSAKNKS